MISLRHCGAAPVFLAALIAAGMAAGLYGCGGGRSSTPAATSGGTDAARRGQGSASFTVNWPAASRLIPFAANSIRIRITNAVGTQLLAEGVLTRPSGGGQASKTFDRLPVGDALVTATGFPNADATGVAQAQAGVLVTIVKDQIAPVHLTLASTIVSVDVSPAAPPALSIGQSAPLVATPRNAAGNVVLITPSTLRWETSASSVATVDVAGNITAVGAGTATITATETESGKSGTAALTVSPAPTPTPPPSVSPDGAIYRNPANGHYYQAVYAPSGITWEQARIASTAAGGYLATITSDAENRFVYALVDASRYWRPNNNGQLGPWLGGYRQAVGSTTFLWVTSEPFSFTNWAPGQPDNARTEDKLQFFVPTGASRAPTWNDLPNNYSPDNPLAYVIEWDQTPPTLTDVPDSAVKYNAANGHYYELVRTSAQLIWSAAKTAAEGRSYRGARGHLVTVTSAAETTFIAQNFDLSQSAWLGAYQDTTAPDFSEPRNGWRWVTGETWSYVNWSNGEPNNVNPSENFAVFNWFTGTWNDIRESANVDVPRGYLVEYEPTAGP
jgi:hypothetical protein